MSKLGKSKEKLKCVVKFLRVVGDNWEILLFNVSRYRGSLGLPRVCCCTFQFSKCTATTGEAAGSADAL